MIKTQEVLETARANPAASEQMAHRARTQAHALLNDTAAPTSCGADLDPILAPAALTSAIRATRS